MKIYSSIVILILNAVMCFSQDTLELRKVNTNLDYYRIILESKFGRNYDATIFEPDYFSDLKELFCDSILISQVTNINQEKLVQYYNFWKLNDNFVFNKQFPVFSSRKVRKALNKNKIPISVSGLIILPEGFIVTVLRVYCKGLCMSKQLLIYKKTKLNCMYLYYSDVLDVT